MVARGAACHSWQLMLPRTRRLGWAVAPALLLVLLACKQRSAPDPAPAATTAAPPPGAVESVSAPVPRAVVQAGKGKNGAPRRGIVRAEPRLDAAEITRLDSGTAVGIVEKAHGAWLKIRWPYPSGANVGFIHADVVRVDAAPLAVASPPAPAAVSPRPGGPCSAAQESSTALCRCPDGRSARMVCLPRSLTWSACDCAGRAAKLPDVQPDQRGFCSRDADCRAPYRCGFQGTCMIL
jgi:hypothetical protein